jgi:hypothetical protein
MNFTSKPFRYEAVAEITVAIGYLLETNENPGDKIELLKHSDEEGDEYTIYVKLSLDEFINERPKIEALIIEKYYSEEQNIDNFGEYSKKKINSYVYKLIGFSGDWLAQVNDIFVNYNGRKYCLSNNRDTIQNSQYYVLKQINSSKLRNLITNPKSEFLDEYIERYYFIENMQKNYFVNNNLVVGQEADPVLLLVNLSNLFELIQENEKGDGDSPLEKDEVVEATRALVVHGLVNHQKTVRNLNTKLGKNEINFKFSRNNSEHMKLVREANLHLRKVISEYLEELLRNG